MASARSAGLGFAVLSSVAFAGSAPFAKALIGAGLTPQQAAWIRITGAALVLVPLVLVLRGRSGFAAARRTWPQLVLYGLTGIAGCQALFFIAASRLPVGVAILLEFLGPVLVVCWLKVVRRSAVPRSAAVGVGLALVGLACVVQIWSGLTLDLVGLLAGLGAAACQATYFLLIDRLTGQADPLLMTAAGSVVGALALTVITAPWALPWQVLPQTVPIGEREGPAWLFAAWIILVSTVVAYLAGAAAVQRLSAAVGGAVAYLEVVAATVFAWLLLNERLTMIQAVGGLIVLAGAFVAQTAASRSTGAAAVEPAPPPETEPDTQIEPAAA
jgi:drug/metabolite transporter (DMT)-like permease